MKKKKLGPFNFAFDLWFSTGIRALLFMIPMILILGIILGAISNLLPEGTTIPAIINTNGELGIIGDFIAIAVIYFSVYLAANQLVKKIYAKYELKKGTMKTVLYNVVGIYTGVAVFRMFYKNDFNIYSIIAISINALLSYFIYKKIFEENGYLS